MAEKNKTLTPEKAEASESPVAERTKDRRTFVPAVDILEDSNNLYIYADMPGTDEKGVNITLENDVLTIEGRVDEYKAEGLNLCCSEYKVGDYHRVFNINEPVDRDKIEARMKNGVLNIVLPKAESVKAKSIPVRA